MLDKYKQAFQEEARELLSELESALLELDQRGDDPEVVRRAFRALHTIKGSGAMFGFDEIAAFTHGLESAFDRLRDGKLKASADLINLSLAAGDQIRAMLEHADGHGTVDQGRSAEILAELQRLTGGEERLPAPIPVDPVSDPVSERVSDEAVDWKIVFRPGPRIFVNGTNPVLLLRELRALGSLDVRADSSAVPSLAGLDVESCYLAWEMTLTTSAPQESIRDVFIFVEDDCELIIEPVAPPAANRAAPVPAPGRQTTAGPAGPPNSAASSSIRVSADKLDQLVNLVGELVTVQARLGEVAARREDSDIREISEAVDRLTTALRENSMSIRMLPLKSTFERVRRLVHDLGAELHKEVELVLEGADTELDKTVIDQLNDPLVHLIRNSMDHGIETPQARLAAGKTRGATIHLTARHSGAHVLVCVADDGTGLNVEAVRARAIERGLIDATARLTDTQVFSLIMEPGFSTAARVTEVSGRGVGMDVVRRNVEALRGSVEIESRPGLGMTVTLRLPLTLAIIDGLLVRVGSSHFVLPLANSLECVELTRRDIEQAHGSRVASVRGELIPYIRLSEYFQIESERPDREQIMVVETEYGHFGFVVDQVLGDHQTVIKNLGRLYRHVQVVSGATILGNGTVALILDPHRLVHSVLQGPSLGPSAGAGRGAAGQPEGRQPEGSRKHSGGAS